MKVKIFFAVITIFLLPFNLMANNNIKNWLETKGKYLIQTFGEPNQTTKLQKLDKLLLEDVDLDYISTFVVGKYYRTMSAEQKERYKKAFKNYALYTYKKLPLNFGEGINFEITKIYQDKNFIIANTTISINPENSVDIEFVLKPYQTTYKIVDIKITQSSLILSYRTRFYEMISQADDEIDWFIEDLEALAEDNNGY